MQRRVANREIKCLSVLRQRRPHKKSRAGCANCRFRRVKCDEEKPACQRCHEYMIPCSYDTADLSSKGEQVIHSTRRPSCSAISQSCGLFTIGPASTWSHEILFRFCNRTVLTMGSPSNIARYADVVPRLAMQHEYLFHVVVATTLLHDRALSGSQSTASELYHLGRAAATLSQKLSSEIKDGDKDALWATGVYMCLASVFSVASSDAECVWPLSIHSDDLKWLNLQAGLRVIWSLTDLNRPGGNFADVGDCPDENCVFPRIPEPGIVGLPPLLVDLCGLTEMSNASNNPYHTAIRYLSWLLPIECSPTNMLTFMIFAGGMVPVYRRLLHEKDPRALLLMAIWYSRLFNASWWMAPRAQVECRAIYHYLDRLQIIDPTFGMVLGFLGRACELHDSAPSSRDERVSRSQDPELILSSFG